MSKWLPRVAMAVWVSVLAPWHGMAQDGAAATSGPRLELSANDFDLGRLDPHDTPRPLEVTIRNAGDRPLDVKVRTSCICLRADRSALTLRPGDAVPMQLQGRLLPFEDTFEEEALLYSNDPAKPVSKIRVFASVGTAIRVTPQPGIPVGVTYRGDLGRLEFPSVRLTAVDGAPLGKVRIIPSQSWIRAEGTSLEDGSYELKIVLDQSVPLGPVNEGVRVETEHPAVPVVQVPVIGTIVGDLDPAGRRIDFGFIKEGQPATVRFLLRNRGERDVKIISAEAKLPVPAVVEVTPQGKEFEIAVSIASAPAFTRLAGRIDLHTDNSAEPLVQLQVFGGVLSKRPFEQVATDGSDARFLATVKDVLARGERISAEDFFAQALGGVTDQRAVAILVRVTEDGELPQRMRAVQLLAGLRTPAALDRVHALTTDDPHEFVRALAAAAYSDATGKSAVPVLLLALQDNDSWVRQQSAISLGKVGIGNAAVVPALRAALNDPDPDAAAAVRSALTAVQASLARQ